MAGANSKRSVNRICKKLGKTRAWFYKEQKQRKKREIDKDQVLVLVRQERAVNPRSGTRKVLLAIKNELDERGIKIGRNKLHGLLKANNMLIEKRKVFRTVTTKFDPSLPVSRNLVKDMKITLPFQAICTDITYISTKEGFLYLTMMTDMCSRYIVSYDISDSLKSEGACRALRRAMKSAPNGSHTVVHSDRGCQFASHAFRAILKGRDWQSSMTEELHCFENAMAERLNGILKNEYFLDRVFATKREATKAIEEVIYTYNNRRLHEKLGYLTPKEFIIKFLQKTA